jgi:hypothetical protein
MKYIIAIVILSALACSNRRYSKEEIMNALTGRNKDSIIAAVKQVAKTNDTSYIRFLLVNADDIRISHKKSSYGRSIYSLRMNAIKSITGKSPNVPISDAPDSTVIKYYQELFSN